MRLYHIAEAEGSLYRVRTALGVDTERWTDLSRDVHQWRLELLDRYGIPLHRELRPMDLLSVEDPPTCNYSGSSEGLLTPAQGEEVFLDGLRRIENFAVTIGGLEVINVCLSKRDFNRYEQVSLDRLLNRTNTSVMSADRQAFLIFAQGEEETVNRTCRRLRIFNPVPSRYGLWDEGEKTRNIPVENIIGGAAFRNPQGDLLLQMAGFIAHALLLQEEKPSIKAQHVGILQAFAILDMALNRRASRLDPQGIVRW